jgi:hypothetical protein
MQEIKFQAQEVLIKPMKINKCWRIEMDVPEIEYPNVSSLGAEAFKDNVYEVTIKIINSEKNG